MNYVVIHKNQMNENAEVFGPFKNIADAKSWMAQDFGDTIEALESRGEKVRDFWIDGGTDNGKFANCGIEHTNDTWEVAEFFGR